MARRHNVRTLEPRWWGLPPRLAAPRLVRARGGEVAVPRVLLAEDVQPLNVGAVPCVTRPDILGNQGAQCVEREVVGLGFARRRICAEGVLPSANGESMQLRDPRAAEPVQLLGAAAAEVMPKERGVDVNDYFPADAARVPRPLQMWGFTGGHPEERYRS